MKKNCSFWFVDSFTLVITPNTRNSLLGRFFWSEYFFLSEINAREFSNTRDCNHQWQRSNVPFYCIINYMKCTAQFLLTILISVISSNKCFLISVKNSEMLKSSLYFEWNGSVENLEFIHNLQSKLKYHFAVKYAGAYSLHPYIWHVVKTIKLKIATICRSFKFFNLEKLWTFLFLY